MATTDVPHAQRLGRGEVRPEARCARPQPAVPALTVSGESALFYLWFISVACTPAQDAMAAWGVVAVIATRKINVVIRAFILRSSVTGLPEGFAATMPD